MQGLEWHYSVHVTVKESTQSVAGWLAHAALLMDPAHGSPPIQLHPIAGRPSRSSALCGEVCSCAQMLYWHGFRVLDVPQLAIQHRKDTVMTKAKAALLAQHETDLKEQTQLAGTAFGSMPLSEQSAQWLICEHNAAPSICIRQACCLNDVRGLQDMNASMSYMSPLSSYSQALM